MDGGENVWVVAEADGIHHVFADKDEAIEYGQTVAMESGESVNVTDAMFNAANGG